MSGHLSIRLGLLDKQVVDSRRLEFGRVDDLELAFAKDDDDALEVAAILTGAQALGERLGGTLGGWMAGTATRLRSRSAPEGPTRIDPAFVVELEPAVRLSVPLDQLPEVAGLERWLARKVIGRLPGAGDASE